MKNDSDILLQIKNLEVGFHLFEAGLVPVLSGVDLTIHRGETIGLVGESGSGKSVTAMSGMRLLDEPPAILSGEILCHDHRTVDILKLQQNGKQMRSIRGNEIAMIFQEPMRALSPVFTVGHQVSLQQGRLSKH